MRVIALLLFIFATNLGGQEIKMGSKAAADFSKVKAKIIFDTEIVKAYEGDLISAQIIFHPYEGDEDLFKKLKKKTLNKSFYFHDIVQIKRSANNFDVIEVDVDIIILKKTSKSGSARLKMFGTSIPFSWDNIDTIEIQNKSKKTIFVDPPIRSQHRWIRWVIGLIGLFLLLGLVGYFIRRYLKNRLDKKTKKLIESINTANSREDFENLYRPIKNALANMDELESLHEFCDQLNQIQYQKDWSVDDLKRLEGLMPKMIEDITGSSLGP